MPRDCTVAYKRIPTSAKIASMIKTAAHAPKMTAKQKYEHDMAVHKAVVASHQNSGMINSTGKSNRNDSVEMNQDDSKMVNVSSSDTSVENIPDNIENTLITVDTSTEVV